MVRTVGELFERCGGPARVGRALGIETEHAGSFKRRGSIPVGYWKALVEWAVLNEVAGVTYEALALMHARPATPEAPQPAGAAQ